MTRPLGRPSRSSGRQLSPLPSPPTEPRTSPSCRTFATGASYTHWALGGVDEAKKEWARHYTQGDPWVCVKKSMDKRGITELTLGRRGGGEQITICGDKYGIEVGNRARFRLRTDNDGLAEAWYGPLEDILIPVLIQHPPRSNEQQYGVGFWLDTNLAGH